MKLSPSITRLSLQTLTILAIAGAGLGIGSTTVLAQTKPRLSVPAFKNETSWWWWRGDTASDLADALSNELSSTGNFTIVERQQLGAVLSEQELAELGIVRKGSGAQPRQMTGAQYVVLGRVTSYEEGVKKDSTGLNVGGINLGGVRLGGRGRKNDQEAYVAIDLRVVDTTTGEVVHSRTVEGRAKSESQSVGGGISLRGFNLGGDNNQERRTPVGKALRAALVEATDYLSCVMYKKDSCVAQYQEKDTRRRERTRDVLKLE
jgi:curli biogenesis system outer membrane secretion channel CsgG